MADFKAMHKQVIVPASIEGGRGLQKLQARFSASRERLLQMLDHEGPVKQMASWQSFARDLREALGNS